VEKLWYSRPGAILGHALIMFGIWTTWYRYCLLVEVPKLLRVQGVSHGRFRVDSRTAYLHLIGQHLAATSRPPRGQDSDSRETQLNGDLEIDLEIYPEIDLEIYPEIDLEIDLEIDPEIDLEIYPEIDLEDLEF
jgi:hypothetical protein